MEKIIESFSLPDRIVAPNASEALRYMGYKTEADEKIKTLVGQCEEIITPLFSPKCVYVKSKILRGENFLDLGFGKIKSRDLEKNLEGCESVLIFAATLGIAVDRAILKYTKMATSLGVIIDALASSGIENFCDIIEQKLCGNAECKPRFSAGYGDFDLAWQREIIDFLDAPRRGGISLTDSLMMTPTKSVSAIVGMK